MGSGPSGLTLAERLSGGPHRVIVLESGDLKFAAKSQAPSRGEIVGMPYEPLHVCRVRRMGGSTGRRGWGGWCKTLRPEDFEARPHIPHSGWPVTFEEMKPHYRKAFETCRFDGLDSGEWFQKPAERGCDVGIEHAFLAPMKDFADGWRDLADADAKNLTVVYNATATEILTEGNAETVSAIAFTDGQQQRRVEARILVLALGGIENARMLLVSDSVHRNGIGNERDLVGRFFMEHPRLRWGHMVVGPDGGELVDLDPSHINRTGEELPSDLVARLRKGLVLSRELREREGLLDSRTWLQPIPQAGEGAGAVALREAGFWIAKGRWPPHPVRAFSTMALNPVDSLRALRFYKGPARARLKTTAFGFNSIFEQAPNPDSRVWLSRRRDALGVRRVSLDWRIEDVTRRTFRRTQEILAQHLRGQGHTVTVAPWTSEGEKGSRVSWVRHHMGTTRMSATPASGVVDPNNRVFGMRNLYMAGSSVYPTVGNDMVTLTAIALSHRLADTIEAELARVDRSSRHKTASGEQAAAAS
ncbi:GMC family oxidoreductase [Jannaschia ovalis]|uniref:GMC family oxidoreductase n=1 Tax=Jannaschia ovalis TaxID=3038773 RepID=A0ABY8LEG9_9RHOB|nr:GMC family oxidoreductase [Jannaschia sp. GRR-S6-38]WGH78705.1 GMC family oxidoreductase [Jannaschia sp. GRR-S6-38]